MFPNLAAYTKERADLQAILLTGIPSGVIAGFQNFTGTAPADMLRLNMAIPPVNSPNPFGILGGDLAGFSNGRRPQDDVVASELRAVAGATIPLVDPSFTHDGGLAPHGWDLGERQFLSVHKLVPLPRLARGRVRQHPS